MTDRAEAQKPLRLRSGQISNGSCLPPEGTSHKGRLPEGEQLSLKLEALRVVGTGREGRGLCRQGLKAAESPQPGGHGGDQRQRGSWRQVLPGFHVWPGAHSCAGPEPTGSSWEGEGKSPQASFSPQGPG